MRCSLADYGVGNIHSISKALETVGFDVTVVTDMNRLLDASCIVFPGVGAFDATVENLLPLEDELGSMMRAGLPVLGICIGAHITMEGSEEGKSPGIGFFGGKVRRLNSRTVPHIGWNVVETEDPLFEGIDSRHLYFAHSFYCDPSSEKVVKATTEYEGFRFASMLRDVNTVAVQFHPEMSSYTGLDFLKAFEVFAEDCA